MNKDEINKVIYDLPKLESLLLEAFGEPKTPFLNRYEQIKLNLQQNKKKNYRNYITARMITK